MMTLEQWIDRNKVREYFEKRHERALQKAHDKAEKNFRRWTCKLDRQIRRRQKLRQLMRRITKIG